MPKETAEHRSGADGPGPWRVMGGVTARRVKPGPASGAFRAADHSIARLRRKVDRASRSSGG